MSYLQCLFTYIRCKPQKLFREIEQKAQPSTDKDINKEKYEVIDGVFDPESGATTVETQQDDELPADAAWNVKDSNANKCPHPTDT
jgi:hypothetical protein